MKTNNSFIEQFIDHYTENLQYYASLAEHLGRECEQLCREEGIKAIVTWRAKDPGRLREKIYKRVVKGPNVYGSVEEIKRDIVDLCGARIALYYPADARRVSDLIIDRFKAYVGKTHPEEDGEAAPGGEYHGHNIRAVREHPTVGWVRLEIQIMTLLMNAWSEISHDDLYQAREGELTDEEVSLLKDINLLVLEVGKKVVSYQNLVRQRPVNQDRHFKSIYDLLDFLGVTFLPENAYSEWYYNTQRKDLLFWLVMAGGYDTPSKLKPLLSLNNPLGPRRALTEFILGERPELLMPYMLQKYPHFAEVDEDRIPIEQIISKWRILDQTLRFLAEHWGNAGKRFSSIADRLKLANLSEEEGKIIGWRWRTIDTLINSISRIPPDGLGEWNDGLSADIQTLSSSANPAMVAAIGWATSFAAQGEGDDGEGHSLPSSE